jgi:hypothetical protein
MNPLSELPTFKRYPALGDEINKIIRYVNSLAASQGFRTRMQWTPFGVAIEGNAPGEESAPTVTMKLVRVGSVLDDHINDCAIIGADGLATGELIKVAKPPELRGSGIRSVPVIGGVNIVESIQPSYGAAVFILAAKSVTDLVVDGTRLEWFDVNMAGRHWHPEYRIVPICIGNKECSLPIAGGQYVCPE